MASEEEEQIPSDAEGCLPSEAEGYPLNDGEGYTLSDGEEYTLSEAEEYELFGYPDTTVQDCDFLVARFAASGAGVQRVLDIACGTGRHALELAGRGYRVTGVDISPAMLSAATIAGTGRKASRQRPPAAFPAPELVLADMRDLVFREGFEAALILFNTISLLTGNDELLRFMAGVRAALKAGGILVIEVGNLWPAIAAGRLGNTTFFEEEERGGVIRQRDTEIVIGPYNNLMAHHEHKRYWTGERELAPRSETYHTRIFSLNELDLACRLSGFRMLEVYGAMDSRQKLADSRLKRADSHQKLAEPGRVEDTPGSASSYVLVLQKEEV